MSGLTERKHYVVCNINKRVYWTHTNSPNTALHFKGRCFYRNTVKTRADISRATVNVLDFNGECGSICGRGVLLNFCKWEIVKRRDLTRYSVVTPKVRAVCHRLVIYFKYNIVKLKSHCKRCTCFKSKCGKVHNFMIVARREEIGKTNLNRCADHTE